MSRFLVCLAVITFCTPVCAGFRAQRIQQIPTPQPGQQISALRTDSQGNLIVATVVTPVPPNNFTTDSSGRSKPPADPFVSVQKLDAGGNVVFSRSLPASGVHSLAIDSKDDVYVLGGTPTSRGFPFTAGLALTPTRDYTIFVAKLRGQDGTMVYATSLGETNAVSIVVDTNGQALIATSNTSDFLTTPGAYTWPPAGSPGVQVYLVRLSEAGDRVIFSARYGGVTTSCNLGAACTISPYTPAQSVVLDVHGNIWIAGRTNTIDLPATPNAPQSTCGCSGFEGFLAEFSADGSRLLYATYVSGGVGGTGISYTEIAALAEDRSGHIWMIGNTAGSDFPVTAKAVPGNRPGFGGTFIAEYDPGASRPLYGTYFGGDRLGGLTNIQIGPDGTVLVAGNANLDSLPLSAAGFTRGGDFVASIDPRTYAISLTKFPDGSTGSGLSFTTAGSLVVSGPNNFALFLKASGSSPSIHGVANSAGPALAGQVAPGEIISLYGENIGPATPVIADLSLGRAPTSLGGVQVLVDGNPAPLLYAQSDQINAIVPFGANATTRIVVNNAGASSNEAQLGVVSAMPEAFQISGGLSAALNQDGTVNSRSNPAQRGSIVSVFGTGFGPLTPQPNDGSLLTGTLPGLQQTVQVLYVPDLSALAGTWQYLGVTYAGPAPTLVAGVMQVNFRLPTRSGTLQFIVNG